jgi:hypothetical protein
MFNIKKVIQITSALLKHAALISALVEIIAFAHSKFSSLDKSPKQDEMDGHTLGV